MAKRETLSGVDTPIEWPDMARAMLDTYLREFGISAEATRSRWINRVIDEMATQVEPVAAEDILEDALEHMRDLLEARVAMVFKLDSACDHKEIARILVVLFDEKHADYLNMLFEHIEPDGDFEIPEYLRNELASSLPIPVPEEAPLVMPVQNIELRSLNPLRRLFGRCA